jgi:ribose transport system substrate-binding protein
MHRSPLKGVAVTVGDLGNPFFVQIAHGAQDAAKKINPSVKFSAESSNYDVNNQTNQMDNFVSSGVSLILLNAVPADHVALPWVRKIVAEKFPDLGMDAQPGNSDPWQTKSFQV